MKYILNLAAKGQIVENLKTLGVEKEDQTNMNALHARLFTMAMGGNLAAYQELMRIGGFDPEENRKERESINSDKRRNVELDAKKQALGANPENTSVSVNMNDEDGNSDIVIYLPQLQTEEECEYKEDEKDGADKKEGSE